MITSGQCILRLGLLLAAALAGAVPAHAQSGRPIKFSEPRSARGQTNTESLMPGRTRLDQLETDLNRSFNSWTPGRSLDGMIIPTPAPLPQPVTPNPRAREKEDNKRDWMFLNPREVEEIYSSRPADKLLQAPALTPDGRVASEIRPMERRYLESIEGNRAAMTNNAPKQGWGTEANP